MCNCTIIGLVFCLFGSGMLVTVNRKMFNMIKSNFTAIEATMEALLKGQQNIPFFTGFDKQYERIIVNAIWRNAVGFISLIIGTCLQIAGSYIGS